MPQSDDIALEHLDHLGVVAGMLKKCRIAERIDNILPLVKDQRTRSTHGQRVAAMILNGLGFTERRLYLTPQFFEEKPVAALLGDGLKAADFNDDALGRTLDALFEQGTTKLFSQLAFDLSLEHGLLDKCNHLDSTSLALFGDGYADEDDNDEGDSRPQVPKPDYGYSKDHRPDLKQIVVSLVANGPAGLPLWYDCQDGNTSDRAHFHQIISNFKDAIRNSEDFHWIADSALYTEGKLKASGITWTTRIPNTLKPIRKASRQDMADDQWQPLSQGYRGAWLEAPEGERWLLIHSEQAEQREKASLKGKVTREQAQLEKALRGLSRRVFACVPDAFEALAEVAKNSKYHRLFGEPEEVDDTVILDLRCEVDEQLIQPYRNSCGRFVLGTNDASQSAPGLLSSYKEQDKVERGFRFIKDKQFQLNHIYLKKASRIDALMMIMTLCLFVYNLAQYQLRQRLKETGQTVPDQKGKPTSSPTLRWVFRLLEGISFITQNDQWLMTANVSETKKEVLALFGEEVLSIYKLG